MNFFKIKVIRAILMALMVLCSWISVSGMQGQGNQDLLQNLDYVEAFNQDDLFQKFKPLMNHWGCNSNVFSGRIIAPRTSTGTSRVMQMYSVLTACGRRSYRAIHRDIEQGYTESDYIKFEQQFKQECLARLALARRNSILKQAREAALQLGLTGCAMWGTLRLVGSDSMGGSFGVLSSVFNSVHHVRDIAQSGLALLRPTSRPLLDALEKRFAENKCFIPRALWPAIIEKFSRARTNSFEAQSSLNFLEFTLGLTYYKPKPIITASVSLEEVCAELFRRIDRFFADYEYKIDQLDTLKISVCMFLEQLFTQQRTSARYQYLFGPGGIGKTHFVKQLCLWLEELVPGSIYFEDLIIRNPVELEGTEQQPGAYLRILRNQLQSGKQGAVIFMDEATWLNDPCMVSDAKRAFNGNLTEISTRYFGDGLDGSGIKLALPPMLVFVASNELIKDEALGSRFDTTTFPLPTKDALVRHAYQKVKDITFSKASRSKDGGMRVLRQEIEEKNKLKTFRDIEAFVGPFILRSLR